MIASDGILIIIYARDNFLIDSINIYDYRNKVCAMSLMKTHFFFYIVKSPFHIFFQFLILSPELSRKLEKMVEKSFPK